MAENIEHYTTTMYVTLEGIDLFCNIKVFSKLCMALDWTVGNKPILVLSSDENNIVLFVVILAHAVYRLVKI